MCIAFPNWPIEFSSEEEEKPVETFNPKPDHPTSGCPSCGEKTEWKLDASGWWREFCKKCHPETISV